VIIGVNPHKSKMYYEFDYDPTKDEPPTCFSDNGVGPSSQATTPQSPTCAMCPNNAWGSDTSKMTGKPTKACSDRKKLAVIVVNDPSQLVYQLQIPPASLKHLSVLANALKGHQVTDTEGPRAADPADVVTRVYFNPQKQGELLFQPLGFHQQMAPYIMDLIDKADASGVIELAIGTNDVPYQGAIALPNPQVVQALPAPAQQMQAPPPPAPHAGVPMATQSFAPQGQPLVQPTPQGTPMPPSQGFAPTAFPSNGQQQPQQPAPAPRTRRGGARQGAGRPPQNGAPPAQPQAAQPFTGAPQAPVQGNDPGPMPPFLQRPAAPAQAAAPAPAPAFGMTNGAAPDPGLTAALTQAFGAPMQPRAR
jgi:hypothetical protein